METLLSSFALVAASEMGDKTQLLAFSLSARFKRPIPILAGILVATVLNHALAASLGSYVAGLVSPETLKIALAVVFFVFALWTLKPDTLDEKPDDSRWGAFVTTTVLFFLAEMGDKTQLATVALGARFASAVWVTVGTTLGMMVTDGLAVFAGHRLAERLPMKWIRRAAALLFLIFGILVLVAKAPSLATTEPAERAVSAATPSAGSTGGFWVGERKSPRAFVLVAHGLNLKPSRMKPIADLACNSETLFACRILELPGHEESSPPRMRQVSSKSWKEAIVAEIDQLLLLAHEREVPVYFLGYSLGGLMGEWALSQSGVAPFRKVILIAPAIATRLYTKSVVYFPLLDRVGLPSKNHPNYRANSFTSLAAYRAMFSIMSEVKASDSRHLDVPTLVFLNSEDELVSDDRLKAWAEKIGLSHWEWAMVPPLKPSLKPSYQHLMVDEASMGPEAWSQMSSKIREFLR